MKKWLMIFGLFIVSDVLFAHRDLIISCLLCETIITSEQLHITIESVTLREHPDLGYDGGYELGVMISVANKSQRTLPLIADQFRLNFVGKDFAKRYDGHSLLGDTTLEPQREEELELLFTLDVDAEELSTAKYISLRYFEMIQGESIGWELSIDMEKIKDLRDK